jgi:hypothetical protein
MNQSVPGWVPAGTYRYNAKAGLLPDLVAGMSSFEFTKTGAALSDEGDLQEGSISGWVLKSSE